MQIVLQRASVRAHRPIVRNVHVQHGRSFGVVRPRRIICRAEAGATAQSLISRAEIPAFIPRNDMMDQLWRWATIEAQENGVKNFGMPMTLDKIIKDDSDGNQQLWGYKVSIFWEGVKKTDLLVQFDDVVIEKHEWVGRGEDGFPSVGGKAREVPGKHFEIWKLGEEPVDADLRATIRAFCGSLAQAVNSYYSFGSVFSEDL